MNPCFTANSPARWVVALIAVAVAGLVALPQAAADDMRDIVHTETLDNGLDVVVLPDSSVPIVTIELAVRYGAFAESENLDGLAHLYEHMFFKGNDQIPNQEEYMERIRELGIVFNGTTGTERVNYFFTLPSDNLSEGLDFMYHATTSPLFDEDEFEQEKDVIYGEADRAMSNPHFWLRRGIRDLLWYEHPHRKDPLGNMEVIEDATTDDMRHIQDLYYVPNNSVLTVAGDVEPDDAVAYVEEHFGQWERGDDPFETEPVPEHPPLQQTAVTIVEESVQIPAFQLAWHGPGVDVDPEATYAADVLMSILRQPTSQFQQNLVESRIALSARKSYYTQRNVGPSSITVQAQPDNLREAIRATLMEVQNLADPDYYTDEQLESAKTMLSVSDIYSREKTSNFAHTLTFWWAVAGIDYYFNYVPNLQAVTRDDIARYVDEYILDEEFVLGVLISEPQRQQLDLTEDELLELIGEVQDEIEEETTDEDQQAITEDGAESSAQSQSDQQGGH